HLTARTRAARLLPAFPTRRSSDLRATGQERDGGRHVVGWQRAEPLGDEPELVEPRRTPLELADQRRQVPELRHGVIVAGDARSRSEEHTSELQSLAYLVCRLLLEK